MQTLDQVIVELEKRGIIVRGERVQEGRTQRVYAIDENKISALYKANVDIPQVST